MPITITEKRDGRTAGHNADWERTYTRAFQAKTTDPHIGPVAVKAAFFAATGITIGKPYSIGTAANPAAVPPVVASPWYEEDLASGVVNVDVANDIGNDGLGWTITVQYGPWQPKEENPLDEPEEVEIGGDQRDDTCDADVNDNAVVNSAGDYFDPPVTRERHLPTLQISRNEPYDAPNLSAAYSDTINDAPFFGEAAGTVKCGLITRTRQWHQAVPGGFFWKTRYPFSLNRDGWKKSILDQGLRKKVTVGSTPTRQQIAIDGQPATSPVLLDGGGGVLAPGGTPVFREFDVYEAKDFSVFGFAGA